MNTKALTILKIIISLLSCCIFIAAFRLPSAITISQILTPTLLLFLSFCSQTNSKAYRIAVLGAAGAALGFLFLYEKAFNTISPVVVLLATIPFFYCWLNGCCGKTHQKIEQMLQIFTESKIFFCICLAVSLAGLSAQLFFAFSPNIWLDEAFSISLTAHPWGEMISIAATDVHPPLYYIILKSLTELFHLILPSVSTICIGKLVSVLPYALLLVVAVTKVRRTWGNYVGGLWGASLFAAPTLITQGVEIRMYGWAVFFVTLAYLFAYDVIVKARKRDWCCFTLAGLASAYTHYYACIAVTPVYLLLLYTAFRKGRHEILCWLTAAIATVVGYLPWLFVFINQAKAVKSDYWVSYPNSFDFYSYASILFHSPVTAGAVVLIIFLVLHSAARTKEQNSQSSYILTGFVCGGITLGVGLAVTYLIRPILVFRYLYPGLACFWLAAIIGAKVSARNLLKFSFTILIANIYLNQFLLFCLNEGKQDKELVRLTEEFNRHPDAVLITDSNAEQRTLSTLTGRTCLTFDKRELSELSKQVYPVCRHPYIADIQSFLNQEKHPAYIVMLAAPAHGSDKSFLPRQYYVGNFFESVYFDMYVIPSTENGAEH